MYYPKKERSLSVYTEERHNVKNSVGRLIFVLLAVLFQAGWIILQMVKLNQYSVWISLVTTLLTIATVLYLYNRKIPMGYKLLWIVLILAFPVLGLSLYLLLGRSTMTRKMAARFRMIEDWLFSYNQQDEKICRRLEAVDQRIAGQAKYIRDYAKYPVYQNTDIVFYDEASRGFLAQLEEIKKAEKFIFMEYHAIEDETSFSLLKSLLIKKAKEGVEVRVLYDDMGSIGFIDRGFAGRMESEGIQCRIFNQIMPILNVFMNNRDHRKITVIDGKTGFTGGYNLADEYFNITNPYGQWKDTGIKLTGDAVKSLTLQFLEMWNSVQKSDGEDISRYLKTDLYQAHEQSFVQPYADIPLDEERVGESVYMNLIKYAKDYIYFTTPYLIISDEMSCELELAAKRGVDVRIITPGIPDKKPVYQVTRSYYTGLVQAGVRIYEYTPGFMHAKQCICDDECAVIGTINLDYRSLYLHFENGVFLYRSKAIADMKKDFQILFEISREVTEQYQSGKSRALKIGQSIWRMFSPLL
ncbi:MAG: cardiolipin synthase [Lachnospiraceae bacterium]